jgi:hypothetical protein
MRHWALLCAILAPGIASGQTDSGGGDRAQFFIGQKIWAATWDIRMLDALIVVPDPSNPASAVATITSASEVSQTKAVPITTIGGGIGNFVVSASLLPPTRFDADLSPTGSIKRSEYELALGYAITPRVIASLVYRTGKLSDATTARAASLASVRGELELKGLLLGIGASAPLQSGWSLYGNAAFGPGKSKLKPKSGSTLPEGEADLKYAIVELGFSYQFVPGIANTDLAMTFQAGYRAQSVESKAFDFPQTIPVVNETGRLQSNTQGFVLGLSVAF